MSSNIRNNQDSVVVVALSRTPIGAFLGGLTSLSAVELGAHSIRDVLSKTGLSSDSIDHVIMGHVLTAGAGQAPARQAALKAGLSESTVCMTVNKVCGSGLKAIEIGMDMIRLNKAKVVVCGGMESMSNAPHVMTGSRKGAKLGAVTMQDSLVHDGLWDVYNDCHMGVAAEACAKKYGFSREVQDAFAIQSYQRALDAQKKGVYTDELAPINIKQRKGETCIDLDESPQQVNFDKMKTLRPVFDAEGTITAANASSINDGAAVVMLMSERYAQELSVQPLARLLDINSFSHQPLWFSTAPVGSMHALFNTHGLSVNDIDLFEINEAFAVVPLACQKELGISDDQLNIYGGAISMGHPIGASGARIVGSLIHSLRREKKLSGVASVCIGGGEAMSALVEVMA